MKLYGELLDAGIDVLLDDRKERPGVMFADTELIGIPHRLTFAERGLDNGIIEYQSRIDSNKQEIPMEGIVEWLRNKLGQGSGQ